jgi:hypothetical protein
MAIFNSYVSLPEGMGWFILVVILPIPGKIGDTTQPFLET